MTESELLAFVRHAVDASAPCPSPDGVEWATLLDFSRRQAVAGVMYDAVERDDQLRSSVPRAVALPWYALRQAIARRNAVADRRAADLTGMLRADGFACLVLKGQGNALMYPDPSARTPGDIDALAVPLDQTSATGAELTDDECRRRIDSRRREVTDYVRRRFPDARLRYQHIDYDIFPDVEVEMHTIPTAQNNPLHNRRIQAWVERQLPEQLRHIVPLPDGAGSIAVPTAEFNIVYQLSHMMHHFFDEGIGLRQMMDYYYLLLAAGSDGARKAASDGATTADGEARSGSDALQELQATLRHLNLYDFAGAVMYVMREAFGLDERYCIVPVDEWRGRTLMDEIMRGGNFGQNRELERMSAWGKFWFKTRRNMTFVRQYPAEALSEPLFRTWHFFWRAANR